MSREYKTTFSWHPSRSLIACIRAYQRYEGSPGIFAAFARKVAVARHRFWSIVTASEVPINTRIGGGLLLPHPVGIVIHRDAQIGPNCLIFQNVTIGRRFKDGVPTIGGHVDIGAGAKILGAVRIGDHARIGANAVVLHDVPPGKTVFGIPAKVVDP